MKRSIGVLEYWSGGWEIQQSGRERRHSMHAGRSGVFHSSALPLQRSAVPLRLYASIAFLAMALCLTCRGQPPIITQQPQSQMVSVGCGVTFSVTVSSVSFVTYQWRFNGVNIPGATSAGGNTSTYTISNVQSNNAGNYSVACTNSGGFAISANATLTVGLPNLVPAQPPGWTDKIVVSTRTGTTTDDSPLTTTNTLYVDLAIQNTGNTSTCNTFSNELYLDGVLQATFVVNSALPASSFIFATFQDYVLGPLGAGSHSLKIKVDSGNQVLESSEGDNEYTKTISVISPPVAFTNAAGIIIQDDTNALPYPSTIAVANQGLLVNKVTATLSGFTHTSPVDVSALLVGPQGQKVMLMAHTGGGFSVTNVNLTFDDAASSNLPISAKIVSGTYLPTTKSPPTNAISPPAPGPPYVTNLSVFNGTDPNGTWSLYVTDDLLLDSGTIAGWKLNISATTIHLSSLSFTTNGFKFRLTGPAGAYGILVSTDLVNWSSIGTTNTSTGVFDFTDAAAGNFIRRFYRTQLQ